MSNVKIEGTFRLDGLLEGPLFSADDENLIAKFVEQCQSSGLRFYHSGDGGRFSLLPDTKVAKLPSGAESVDSIVVKCLNELLKDYSPEELAQLMSTLRSVEYIANHEIQTLYGIKPDGKVSVEQRVVKADTICPAPKVDWRYKVKLAAVAAVVVLAGLGISAFFVPYREMATRLIDNVKPFNKGQLQVDCSAYLPFFQADSVELDKDTGNIVIAFKTTPAYPGDSEAMNQLWISSRQSLPARLAVEAMAKGYLRCEFYDRKGKYRAGRLSRMTWDLKEQGLFYITIPFDKQLGQVRVTY